MGRFERVRSVRQSLPFSKDADVLPPYESPRDRLEPYTGRVAIVGSLVGKDGTVDQEAVRMARDAIAAQHVVSDETVVGVRVLGGDADRSGNALQQTRKALAESLSDIGGCVLQYDEPVEIYHDGNGSSPTYDGYRSLDLVLQEFIKDTESVIPEERAIVIVTDQDKATDLFQRVVSDGMCSSRVDRQFTPEDITDGGIATLARVGGSLRESAWDSHRSGVQG